jgi:hypothetical protein
VITPYVSAAAFTAHPTYLDLDDLRSGDDSAADQTGELTNLLLMASRWADGIAMQPLGAHQYTQNLRTSADRYGNVKIHPDHTPYISLKSFGYGWTPTSLSVMTGATAWAEDGRNLVISLGVNSGPWYGSLQFGTPGAGAMMFTQTVYEAGFVATNLVGATGAGVFSVTVADPTGIVASGVYRIWEPGAEEYVTVSSSFVPPVVAAPPTQTAVPLASPTMYAHASGHDFSRMPEDLRLAVINFTVSQLMRPDTAAEDEYPDTKLSSGTRQADPRKNGSGLVAEAEAIISSYRRVR